jgi:exodeoxyribonuclease V alpha subunit
MRPAAEPSIQEVLAGLVERVTFHNAENGFCVVRSKARGHRDLVTVVGHAAIISAGEWITASGEWINDRAHGQQFKARFLKTSAPSSIDGIEKISRLRHDPGHRARLCQEDGQGLRGEGLRRHRGRA